MCVCVCVLFICFFPVSLFGFILVCFFLFACFIFFFQEKERRGMYLERQGCEENLREAKGKNIIKNGVVLVVLNRESSKSLRGKFTCFFYQQKEVGKPTIAFDVRLPYQKCVVFHS